MMQYELDELKHRQKDFLSEIRFWKKNIGEVTEDNPSRDILIEEYQEEIKKYQLKLKPLREKIGIIRSKLEHIQREPKIWSRVKGAKNYRYASREQQIAYLRKIYCVYRLYRNYDFPPIEIASLFDLNLNGNEKYRNKKRIMLLIGDAFKRECSKKSCFAMPFFDEQKS